MNVDLAEPSTLFALLLSTVVLLRKFGEMDRYHELRVFILTLFLGCIVFLLYLTYGFAAGESLYADCDPAHFCMTEM